MTFNPKVSREMFLQFVDRSQGQMVDATVVGISDCNLLHYVADRSSQLRRLELVFYIYLHERLSEAFEKLSTIGGISLVRSDISEENIEAAGCYCPLLKTLKVNQKRSGLADISDADDELITFVNRIALAIGKNLPELTHLELNGSCRPFWMVVVILNHLTCVAAFTLILRET
ncbi:putative leucine-rich repeat domain superfamily [Helianthus annuus]|nr:putative leucine-rich repeat domain superfamily [Helianthus annuus]